MASIIIRLTILGVFGLASKVYQYLYPCLELYEFWNISLVFVICHNISFQSMYLWCENEHGQCILNSFNIPWLLLCIVNIHHLANYTFLIYFHLFCLYQFLLYALKHISKITMLQLARMGAG